METGTTRVLGDRYELGPVIGRGGMAEVRRAYDRKLARTVAIKCFAPGTAVDERARLRFEQEARCAAAISHSNAIAIFDVGTDNGTPYIVMELLPGRTLADELERGPIAVPRAVDIVRQLLAALDAAHDRGVLHRDIKASNVMFTAEGHVKLTDFGIARAADGDDLTETGMVIGTPSYLAPERVAGEPATEGSDVYAAGVVAYEALSGTRPFRADTPVALAYAILHTPVTPLRAHRPDIPAPIEGAVMRAIAHGPSDRFASARAFSDALAPIAELEPTVRFSPIGEPTAVMAPIAQPGNVARSDTVERDAPWRRRRVPIAAASILAALGVAGFVALDREPAEAPTTPTPTTLALPAELHEPFDALQQTVEP